MTNRFTAAYLQREWPTLEPVPEGRDMFAHAPVYYPHAARGPRMCPQCYGEGKALGPNGEYRECPTCKGRGSVGR